MWSSRLFWKLFLLCVGLNLAFAASVLFVVSHYQETLIREQVRQRLRDTAVVLRSNVAGQIDSDSTGNLQQLVTRISRQTNTRLTLIDPDGIVLADSEEDVAKMDNHRDRPEVRQAAAEGLGVWERVSPTLGIPMYYVAIPIVGNGVCIGYVRAAMPIGSIDDAAASVRRLLWIFAAAVGLISTILVCTLVARFIQPLPQLTQAAEAVKAGHPAQRLPADHQTELGALGAAFNRLQEELANRIDQLRQHGDRLATVLSSMAEGVVVVDGDERVLLANDASKALLEIAAPEVVGRPLQTVCPASAVHQAVRRALDSGEPQQTELDVRGDTRRILSLRAVRLPGDPCPGVVTVLRDLTELRTLANARREFVSNVSHELKTPLTAIKAYAETLRLGAVNDPENNMGFVERIEEQAERLYQLIVDLLALARVESGRETLEIAELPLESLVTSCIGQYRELATSRRIELRAEAPGQPVSVRADEEGLLTILNNLVDNAVKYTPEGGAVNVRWRADGREAVLEVEDTGIGIAPPEQSRVFERFYRVDKARSRALGGTGLGLSIVKHLTQALGGSVELKSALGSGSTFRIRLPRA